MQTAQELYSEQVQHLSAPERLRLATMILEGLSGLPVVAIDISDEWSDEDIKDMATYSAKYASESLGEE